MPNVTVLGVGSDNKTPTIWTVGGGFNQAAILKTAQSLANAITSAIGTTAVTPFTYTGTLPTSPGNANVLYVGSPTSPFGSAYSPISLTGSYYGVVDNGTNPVTITGNGNASGQFPVSIIAGTGGITYNNLLTGNSVVGAGTIVAAGGNNAITIQGSPATVGGFDILLDSGTNTIDAAAGNNSINAGTGNNAVTLGAGANYLNSNGSDTVIGGTGTDTINVQAGSVTYTGGSGGLLFQGGGLGQASSVVGGTGAVTAYGGLGGGYIKGGISETPNILIGQAGQTTLVSASNAGDSLFSAAGGDSLVGSSGGNDTFYSGGSGDTVAFGGGNDTFTAPNHFGPPFTFPSSISDVFQFNAASTHGGNDIINNFTVGADSISLTGYSVTSDTITLTNYKSSVNASVGVTVPGVTGAPGWNSVISLSDGTTITITNVTTLSHFTASGIS
jgi:Ca2+-binding RTX toxin-like protein